MLCFHCIQQAGQKSSWLASSHASVSLMAMCPVTCCPPSWCTDSPGTLQAKLQVLHKGKTKTVTVTLSLPARLIPVQGGRPPSYFIIAGLVFLQATVPYLRSEYGKDFDFEAPVKLLVRPWSSCLLVLNHCVGEALQSILPCKPDETVMLSSISGLHHHSATM